MRFRMGAMSIPYLINLLLQFEDEGRLSLDDPVSEWLPEVPNADQVTLRMLASSTSGYPDWIQGNPAFEDELFADPFRQWTPAELLEAAFGQPLPCEPGACFSYAHTNFAILSKVLHAETGRVGRAADRKRVLRAARPAAGEDLRVPGDAGAGAARVYRRSRPVRGFDVLEPVVDERKGHDHERHDRERCQNRSGDRNRAADLASRRAASSSRPATTSSFPGFSEDLYYGLGINVASGWRFQNPVLNGYSGIRGYQPEGDVSLALTVTRGRARRKRGSTTARSCSPTSPLISVIR